MVRIVHVLCFGTLQLSTLALERHLVAVYQGPLH
jgi:hypothetical protein